MLFKGRKAALDSGKPFLNFGGGIPTQNALAECGLTEVFNALFEFFVIPIHFAIECTHSATYFLEQTKCMVFRRCH